jgi:hypothetical protein
VTLTSSGTAALTVSAIGLSAGTSHYSLSHDCGGTLAAGSACTVTVNFTPTSSGAKSGTVSVTTDAGSSPDTVSLSGTGTAAATGVLAWADNVTSVAFTSTAVGSNSAATTLTLTNTGAGTATLSSIALDGTDAAQFITGGSCVTGSTLAAAASCTVTLVFSPTAAGSKTATLSVGASNASTPATVSLAATATATSSGGSDDDETDDSEDGEDDNRGAGGCTLAPGQGPGTVDPVLASLAAAAALVLLRRRRTPPKTPAGTKDAT